MDSNSVQLLGVLDLIGHKVRSGETVKQAMRSLDGDSRLVALALCHRLATGFGLELHVPNGLVGADSDRGRELARRISELNREGHMLTEVDVDRPASYSNRS